MLNFEDSTEHCLRHYHRNIITADEFAFFLYELVEDEAQNPKSIYDRFPSELKSAISVFLNELQQKDYRWNPGVFGEKPLPEKSLSLLQEKMRAFHKLISNPSGMQEP